METKYFKNSEGAVWQLSDGRVMFRYTYYLPKRQGEYSKLTNSSFDDCVEELQFYELI